MKCPCCGSEMESVYYTNINQAGMVCNTCDLRVGPFDKVEEAKAAVERISIAVDK